MSKLKDKANKLLRDVEEIELLADYMRPEDYAKIVISCAELSRHATDVLSQTYNRHDVFKTYNHVMAEAAGITFDSLPHGIKIGLPNPVPVRAKAGNKPLFDVEYYRSTLYAAFEAHFDANPVHFSNKVLIHICNFYEKESEMVDYDNLDMKALLDMISLFCLPDDNPRHYNLFFSSKIGDKRHAEVSILEDFDGNFLRNA